MKINSISQNQQNYDKNNTFKALVITPKAKALIKSQKGGAERIAKYTKELANSKWDLKIRVINVFNQDVIFPFFGNKRYATLIPKEVKDNFVMVSSVNRFNDKDIVDYLKFNDANKAQEVYNNLRKYFLENSILDRNESFMIDRFDWCVCAIKAFEEAEIVPQAESPWAELAKPITENQVKNEQKKSSFIQKIKSLFS
jgi:hypothetical protein